MTRVSVPFHGINLHVGDQIADFVIHVADSSLSLTKFAEKLSNQAL